VKEGGTKLLRMMLKQLVNETRGPWSAVVRPATVSLTQASAMVGVIPEVICARLQIMHSRFIHIRELIIGGVDNIEVGEKG
jgi:hypothetical protein